MDSDKGDSGDVVDRLMKEASKALGFNAGRSPAHQLPPNEARKILARLIHMPADQRRPSSTFFMLPPTAND